MKHLQEIDDGSNENGTRCGNIAICRHSYSDDLDGIARHSARDDNDLKTSRCQEDKVHETVGVG